MHSYSYRNDYFEERHKDVKLEDNYFGEWLIKIVFWVCVIAALARFNYNVFKSLIKMCKRLEELKLIVLGKKDRSN